ncbi:MAG: Mth938-like domain-containing protein [Tatlockia sp.]|jgi:uncharacterized protein
MYINQESREKHSVQAYSEKEIQIDSVIYKQNLIVSRHEIVSDWNVKSILDLNESNVQPLLQYQPTIVLIGHSQLGKFPPFSLMEQFTKKRIGLECMSIGAACRTYNILLSELREVVLAVIF